MKVYFVSAGPGDVKLLTIKAKELIENCECCIYAGSLVSEEIIALLPADAKRYDSAKMTLEEKVSIFSSARDENMDVVRLHSGDSSIYSAIREQIGKLDELGIEYEVIPGVSSYQAASAALNLELTVPETVQTVILTRTAGRTPVPSAQSLDNLAKTGATLCIFLSVQKIDEVAETLSKRCGKDCPIAVVYRVSRPEQIIVKGTLKNIAQKVKEAGINKTAMIIVGTALEKQGLPSKLYDKNFSHEYRKAK